jgi:DNA-binding response OmpR family regulator
MAGRTVLIVEDEPLLAFEYQDELEAKGARVVIGFTLAEGLFAMEANHFDLALVDINLGDELSWPIASGLIDRSVPFFFVSGRCRDCEIPEVVKHAVCIEKPVAARSVIARLEALLPN